MSELRYMAVRVDHSDFWKRYARILLDSMEINNFSEDQVGHVHAHYVYKEIGLVYYARNVGYDCIVKNDDLIRVIESFYKKSDIVPFSKNTINLVEPGADRRTVAGWNEIEVWADGLSDDKIMREIVEIYKSDPFWSYGNER